MSEPKDQNEAADGRSALTAELDAGTYEKPPHGWTCFHCGETFTTTGSARDHFGATQDARPGCIERVALGGERGLLMALRKAEARIARHMEDDTDLHRAMYGMQHAHADALQVAEEAGYARGVRDARTEATNAPKLTGRGTGQD